jgi:hypothetical protein
MWLVAADHYIILDPARNLIVKKSCITTKPLLKAKQDIQKHHVPQSCLLTKTEKKKKKQAGKKWAKCTRKDKDPTEIMGLLSEHEKRKKK